MTKLIKKAKKKKFKFQSTSQIYKFKLMNYALQPWTCCTYIILLSRLKMWKKIYENLINKNNLHTCLLLLYNFFDLFVYLLSHWTDFLHFYECISSYTITNCKSIFTYEINLLIFIIILFFFVYLWIINNVKYWSWRRYYYLW